MDDFGTRAVVIGYLQLRVYDAQRQSVLLDTQIQRLRHNAPTEAAMRRDGFQRAKERLDKLIVVAQDVVSLLLTEHDGGPL